MTVITKCVLDAGPAGDEPEPCEPENACRCRPILLLAAVDAHQRRPRSAAYRGERCNRGHSWVMAVNDVGPPGVDDAGEFRRRRDHDPRPSAKHRDLKMLACQLSTQLAGTGRDRDPMTGAACSPREGDHDSLGAPRAQFLDHVEDAHSD